MELSDPNIIEIEAKYPSWDVLPGGDLTHEMFVAWLDTRVQEVPAEYRDSIRFAVDAEISYGDGYGYLKVSYRRPETAEEVKRRMEKDRVRLVEERLRYEQLKAKFEP